MKTHWQVYKFFTFQKLFTPKQLNWVSLQYHRLCSLFIDKYEANTPDITYKFTLENTNKQKERLSNVTGLRPESLDFVNLKESFGNYFQDAEGKNILDLTMNQGFNVLGYNPRSISTKTKLEVFQQYRVNSFNNTPSTDYSADLREVNKLAPTDVEQLQLCENDDEAIEQALRFATLAYLTDSNSQSKDHDLKKENFRFLSFEGGSYQSNTIQIPFPNIQYPYPENQADNLEEEDRCIEVLRKLIFDEKEKQTALPALIVEPIQYKAGVKLASPMFFRKVQKLCQEENIKFIVDETYTCGWVTGRTFHHSSWCSEIPADIVVFGGRMQLSGFFHKRDLVDLEQLENLGLRFNILGKPDLTKLNYLLILKNEAYNKQWLDLHGSDFMAGVRTELNEVQKKSPIKISNVRGMGKMFAFDVEHRILRDEIVYECRKHGIKIGTYGETSLLFTPSLIFTEVHFTYFKQMLIHMRPSTLNFTKI
mmetsp:Transcript_41771/g.43774  ORF Transcript_41771/g.43774 Transcript_41771/m.43774 type:complete len:479 (+) Transcript_41771:26-1462(+)